MPAPAVPDAPAVAPSPSTEAAGSGQTPGASPFGSVLAEVSTETPRAKATGQSGPAPQTITDAQTGSNTEPEADLPRTEGSEPASALPTPGQLKWKQIAAQTETPKPATDSIEPQTGAQPDPPTNAPAPPRTTTFHAGGVETTPVNVANTTGAEPADDSQEPATTEPNQSTDTAEANSVQPVVIPALVTATDATAPRPGNLSELRQQRFVASLVVENAPAAESNEPKASGSTGHSVSVPVRSRQKNAADAESKTEASLSPAAPAPVAAPVVTIPAFRPVAASTSNGAEAGKGRTVSPAPVNQDQKISGAPHAAVEVRIRMNGQHGALNTSLLNPALMNGSGMNGSGLNASGLDASASHTRFVKDAPATVPSAAVPAPAVLSPNGLAPEAPVKSSRANASSVNPTVPPPGAHASATRRTSGERVSTEHSKHSLRDAADDSDAASGDNANTKAAADYAGEHSAPAAVGSHTASVLEATPASAVTPSHGAASNTLVSAAAHAPVQTTPTAPQAKADAPPTPTSSARAEDLPDSGKPQQQPLRSMSLEFTPDGARDVRVRLSERGGDVHISLHSTDAALSGRLRDGVQDLAGALNHAGYNADAWASGRDDRQQQQQQRDADQQQRQQRRSPNDADNDFSGMMRQTNQEAL